MSHPDPLLLQAQELTKSGKYEAALQCFLRLDADARATTNIVELETALSDWVQLGEKYPPALQALTDIHDQDMLEFEEMTWLWLAGEHRSATPANV